MFALFFILFKLNYNPVNDLFSQSRIKLIIELKTDLIDFFKTNLIVLIF